MTEHDLLKNLVDKFPQFDPQWTSDSRDAWFAGFEHLLDLVGKPAPAPNWAEPAAPDPVPTLVRASALAPENAGSLHLVAANRPARAKAGPQPASASFSPATNAATSIAASLPLAAELAEIAERSVPAKQVRTFVALDQVVDMQRLADQGKTNAEISAEMNLPVNAVSYRLSGYRTNKELATEREAGFRDDTLGERIASAADRHATDAAGVYHERS